MLRDARHAPALVDPATGQVDKLRLADSLGLTSAEVEAIAQPPEGDARPSPLAEDPQDRLRQAALIAGGLHQLTGGDRHQVAIWLRAPHPDLDDATPLELMRGAELHVVADLVDDALSGAPA